MSNQQFKPTLIHCPACNTQVANQAPACPKCGQPISAASGQADSPQTGFQPTSTLFQQYPQEQPRRKKNSWLVGCLGIFLVLMVIGTIAQIFNGRRTNSDDKNPSANVARSQDAGSASDPTVIERIGRGAKLFEKIRSSPPNPLVTGVAMEYPAITILLRKDRWDKLSKREQVDLTYYAESLVQDARNNPAKYIDIPTSAPYYPLYEKKAKALCAECWAVGTTYPSPHAKGEEEDNRVVVGDILWEQDKSGFRASEFRQQR